MDKCGELPPTLSHSRIHVCVPTAHRCTPLYYISYMIYFGRNVRSSNFSYISSGLCFYSLWTNITNHHHDKKINEPLPPHSMYHILNVVSYWCDAMSFFCSLLMSFHFFIQFRKDETLITFGHMTALIASTLANSREMVQCCVDLKWIPESGDNRGFITTTVSFYILWSELIHRWNVIITPLCLWTAGDVVYYLEGLQGKCK